MRSPPQQVSLVAIACATAHIVRPRYIRDRPVKFENSVDLPLPAESAWSLLLDVPRIAPCLPGAELTEVVDDRNYTGNVSVRLGPVALTFRGKASLESVDDAGHRARVLANGMDTKGRGGAKAIVDFELRENGSGGSTIVVQTDLTLSGAVAQYGRGAGLIREVAAELLRQFAANLKAQLEAERATAPGPAADAAPERRKPTPISGFRLFFRSLWTLLRSRSTS